MLHQQTDFKKWLWKDKLRVVNNKKIKGGGDAFGPACLCGCRGNNNGKKNKYQSAAKLQN